MSNTDTEILQPDSLPKNNLLNDAGNKEVSNWAASEIVEILELPLMDLLYRAQTIHKANHKDNTVQLASLMSIKTGGCPEDCKYCPQSAHFSRDTGLQKESLCSVDDVLEQAKLAREAGASRFCMGAAWRQVRDGEEFDLVLDMVRGVRSLGMEACVTLGMLSPDQATRLAEAGLTAYNHNLDTSPEYYPEIITTRTYEDRLTTLSNARNAGLTLCTGGIVGMGETLLDRARMLEVLSGLDPQPESVPINALVPVEGTPLADQEPIDAIEMVRMIAATRIALPKARVRLSAGRRNLSREAQILCFMAGANSIFYGDKLLTTDNNDAAEDIALIREAGFNILEIPESAET